MAKPTKFSKGDRVIGLDCFKRGKGGIVVKPAPKFPLVRFDGEDADERANSDDLRAETPDDVAARARAVAFAEWQRREPQTKKLAVKTPGAFSIGSHTGVVMHGLLRTPAEMREAARELEALAAWFETKPPERS